MAEEKSKTKETKTPPESKVAIATATKSAQGFVQTAVNALIKFVPIGGSGFAFFSFLLQQQWVLVLITFPATVLAVIWAAYSESVLTRFYKIYKEKGTKDVDSLMAWVEKIDQAIKETIKWQLSGVEDKYLKCQGDDCLFYSTEGTHSTFKPLLKDVFVPLELSGNFLRDTIGENIPNPRGYKWDKQLIQLMNQNDGLTIWDVLKRTKKNPSYRTLAILAWGGYGKTTLLRHITYTYAQKKLQRGVPKLLPVLLLLRKWQTLIVKEKPDLITLIEEHHIPSLPQGKNLKRPKNWARNLLAQNKMLIMFDGFDEVKEDSRESVGQWIAQMMHDYSSAYFILTSRPAGYKSYKAENKPNTLRLKAFNEDQRERFIQKWYLSRERQISAEPNNPVVKEVALQKSANLVEQLQAREELNDLAKNPLLLNMIVNLHSVAPTDLSDLSRQIQLPQRRSALYREIFRLQLGDRPLVKQIAMCLEAEESQRILQGLALFMVQENKPAIEYGELQERLQEEVEKLDESVDVDKFIKQMSDVSELLVKRDEDYEFAHLSFQGYLAAKEIIRSNREDLLIANWQNSWWRETILLYAAQVNPNNLLRQLIDVGTEKAVALAYDCLKETPRKVELEVKNRIELEAKKELKELEIKVGNLLYQPLETYLKNGQWKEADEETYRVMLQVAGKEEEGLLWEEDINKFPCEDLRTINDLWVKYSQGKLGFTVQRDIWFSCGGKIGEYKWEPDEKFAEKVRWYSNKKWFGEMEYDLLAPRGHLPAVLSSKLITLTSDSNIVLFSRTKACNL